MTPVNADHRGLFSQSGYDLVFTTKNPQKVAVGEAIITRFFGPGKVVTVKPPVSELLTPTQPVGYDIKWGAESRIDLVKHTMSVHSPGEKILVSFENGLQVNSNIWQWEKKVYDVACVCLEIDGERYFGSSEEVPVRVDGKHIGLVTDEIFGYLDYNLAGYDFQSCYEKLTPQQQRVFNLLIFGHADGPDNNDAVAKPQVSGFRQRVIEVLQHRCIKDYWAEYSNGRLTRQSGLRQALTSAIDSFIECQHDESRLSLAETFKQSLIRQGLPASLGGRYGQTVWMRDFGIMINTLNHCDTSRPDAYPALLNSLATIANQQYDNGLIPQVVIPDQLLGEFVYQRVLGGDVGDGWYVHLCRFANYEYPDVAGQLPELTTESLGDTDALKVQIDQIKTIYRDLLARTIEDELPLPKPSHTLHGFLTDTLATLTPGTTDSEIHFIRSFTKLLDLASTNEQISQVRMTIPPLARALAYLDQHVLDPQTGLPQGGDNRDMLDAFLLDKLLCSNACFLYQGFSELLRHLDTIGSELTFELKKYFQAGQEPTSKFITTLLHGGRQGAQQALDQLGQQIKNTFIYPDGDFAPKDFVDSDHIVSRQPVAPAEYIAPLVEQNVTFLQGREVNLQGLALAIELGLVNKADHPSAVKLIHSQLTHAGLKVFSPINMACEYEITLLQRSKGFLVWPQIECRVVHVLKKYMDETPEISNLLTELKAIDDSREGFREWYNTNELTESYAGGAKNQSWYITSLVQD